MYFSSGQDEPAVVSTEVEVYGKNGLEVYSISTFSFFSRFSGGRYYLGALLQLHLPTLDPTFDLDLFFDEFQHFLKDSSVFI